MLEGNEVNKREEKKRNDIMPLALFVAFIFISLGGFIGYQQGLKTEAYRHGEEFGIKEATDSYNYLLNKEGYRIFFHYDNKTQTFALDHPQVEVKKNGRAYRKPTVEPGGAGDVGSGVRK